MKYPPFFFAFTRSWFAYDSALGWVIWFLSRYNSPMHNLVSLEPIDYLMVGHIAHDLTPGGWRLGGTTAYSALAARALGMRVGILTASGPETSLEALQGIPVISLTSPRSTTFENIYTDHHRIQYLRAQAARIDYEAVPDAWRRASIIHLGPIANEMDAVLPPTFSPSLLGLTPQGWMRQWDGNSRVFMREWKDADTVLPKAGAVILSHEDVHGNDEIVEHMAHQTPILVMTEGPAGCVVYWNGDRRRFRPPVVKEVDATGAGDVFATSFFVRLFQTRDPWEAGRFATILAAHTVTRVGLEGIPTAREIEECLTEVLQ
jgi:sugar/nucleoside kinase (ribokinase family)